MKKGQIFQSSLCIQILQVLLAALTCGSMCIYIHILICVYVCMRNAKLNFLGEQNMILLMSRGTGGIYSESGEHGNIALRSENHNIKGVNFSLEEQIGTY